MERLWKVGYDRSLFRNYDFLIKRVMKDRFNNSDFEADKSKLIDPFMFKDMKSAVEKILLKIKNNENIMICGDYDVDGITSTYLLFCLIFIAIKKLNSKSKVSYYIPHREKEGYGLNKEALSKIKNLGYSLAITVDNGIANYNEVEHCKSIGLDIIVTDHHDYPEVTPDCLIVSCKDGSYPFKYLSGCGVAYKVMLALYITAGLDVKIVEEYLDIAAISTVCDVVSLLGENRLIVKLGLETLNNHILMGPRGNRVWVKKLLDCAKNTLPVDSYTLGFVIGPRLNTIGRLAHAVAALKFMFETDEVELERMAAKIEEMNTRRKDIQEIATKAAEKDILENGLSNNILIAVDCPVGLVGLAASTLKDKYYRPATIFSIGDKDFYKGSARCIEGINYFNDILEENRDIILKGGGHALAAGLAVSKDFLNTLKTRIDLIVDSKLKEDPELLVPKLNILSELYAEDITLDFLKAISQMEPFGQDNPRPIFMLKNVYIENNGLLCVPKDNPKHMQIKFVKDNKTFKSIFFKSMEHLENMSTHKLFDIAFTLSQNTWNNVTEIQLMIEDYKVIR